MSHYKIGGIETIAYLRAKLSTEEFRGFLKGNTLKYLSRAPFKHDEVQDLIKAKYYLRNLSLFHKHHDPTDELHAILAPVGCGPVS